MTEDELEVLFHQSHKLDQFLVFVLPEKVYLQSLDSCFEELEVNIQTHWRQFDQSLEEIVLFLGQNSSQQDELVVFNQLVDLSVFAVFEQFQEESGLEQEL